MEFGHSTVIMPVVKKKAISAPTRMPHRVPTMTGREVLCFPHMSQYERPMVERNDCIPAAPVCIASEPFYLCGSHWSMLLFPFGCDEEAQWLGVRLRNLTGKEVDISYTLSLQRQPADEAAIAFLRASDCKPWEEPSSFAGHDARWDVFEPAGGSDEWGVDELVLLEELGPLIHADTLCVRLDMEVYSDVDLDSHPLSRLIHGGGECSDGDLVRMADEDLVLLKRRSGGVRIGVVEGLQDQIVSKRGEPAKESRRQSAFRGRGAGAGHSYQPH